MAVKIISKPLFIAVAAGAATLGVSGYVWNEEHRPPVLEIYVFALPNGRSMFIRTPDDKRILIDGGGNADIVRELSKILPFYSRHVDTVIATETAGKDISGLIDVILRYSVDRAYIPACTAGSLGLGDPTDETYSIFLEALNHLKISTSTVGAGDTIVLGQGVSMNALFPVPAKAFAYSKASSPELLFNISYGDMSAMFLGNASVKVQKYIAKISPDKGKVRPTDSDILVVSHSALSANMSPELLNKIEPQYLIYSKSDSASRPKTASSTNPKKKVQTDALSMIAIQNRFNIRQLGTVRIVSDGKSMQIKSSPL
jgi:competence protein ComEC